MQDGHSQLPMQLSRLAQYDQEVPDIEQTSKSEWSKAGTNKAAASRSFTLVQGEAKNSQHF